MNFTKIVKESLNLVDLCNNNKKLIDVLEALIKKVDATSECDHKRVSCQEIGCIGFEIQNAKKVLDEVK